MSMSIYTVSIRLHSHRGVKNNCEVGTKVVRISEGKKRQKRRGAGHTGICDFIWSAGGGGGGGCGMHRDGGMCVVSSLVRGRVLQRDRREEERRGEERKRNKYKRRIR